MNELSLIFPSYPGYKSPVPGNHAKEAILSLNLEELGLYVTLVEHKALKLKDLSTLLREDIEIISKLVESVKHKGWVGSYER